MKRYMIKYIVLLVLGCGFWFIKSCSSGYSEELNIFVERLDPENLQPMCAGNYKCNATFSMAPEAYEGELFQLDDEANTTVLLNTGNMSNPYLESRLYLDTYTFEPDTMYVHKWYGSVYEPIASNTGWDAAYFRPISCPAKPNLKDEPSFVDYRDAPLMNAALANGYMKNLARKTATSFKKERQKNTDLTFDSYLNALEPYQLNEFLYSFRLSRELKTDVNFEKLIIDNAPRGFDFDGFLKKAQDRISQSSIRKTKDRNVSE